MTQLMRWAVVRWLRFKHPRRVADFEPPVRPVGAMSWIVGPDLPASASPARASATVWGAVAGFAEETDAVAAFEDSAFGPRGSHEVVESWRALLLPFAHRGECNHLATDICGLMFEPQQDPGGPLMVMTTAGFELSARSDLQRVSDFRRRVEAMRPTIEAADGNLAHQVFVPASPRDDGITMSLWRNEKAMFSFAYRPGAHRIELDRQNTHRTVDRSSFTRFRVLRSAGEWDGINPVG